MRRGCITFLVLWHQEAASTCQLKGLTCLHTEPPGPELHRLGALAAGAPELVRAVGRIPGAAAALTIAIKATVQANLVHVPALPLLAVGPLANF